MELVKCNFFVPQNAGSVRGTCCIQLYLMCVVSTCLEMGLVRMFGLESKKPQKMGV